MRLDGLTCIYCGSGLVWKHGSYLRKWFYDLGDNPVPVQVPRFLCQNTICHHRTFSCLPYPLLPYIRTYLTGFLILATISSESNSSSKVPRPPNLIDLKMYSGVLKHLSRVITIVERMCRERDLFQYTLKSTRLSLLVKGLLKKATWGEITQAFYHGIFTARIGNNQTHIN